jgi:hypothetical protein
MKGTVRIFKVAVFVAVFTLLSVALVSAVAPNVRQVFTTPVTTVDGNAGDWQVTPLNSTNPDWFSVTCTGGGGGGISCPGAEYGDLFLRFQCSTHTLYVLGLADRGKAYSNDPVGWIGIDTLAGGKPQNKKVVFGQAPYTANLTPPMWRDLPGGTGYEAAIDKDFAGNALVAGTSYTMNFHATMGGATSGTNATTVTLPECFPTAVTLSSFNAGAQSDALPVAGVIVPAVTIAGLLGLVTVAGVRRIRSR